MYHIAFTVQIDKAQILKRPCDGRFTSVTAVSEVKPPPGSRSGVKFPSGLLESGRYGAGTVMFQGEEDARGYGNGDLYKIQGAFCHLWGRSSIWVTGTPAYVSFRKPIAQHGTV
jgi:hypothetical protein